jgi:hypothetical protein
MDESEGRGGAEIGGGDTSKLAAIRSEYAKGRTFHGPIVVFWRSIPPISSSSLAPEKQPGHAL